MNENPTEGKGKYLSRRDFLKAAGLLAASALVAACGEVAETVPAELNDLDWDTSALDNLENLGFLHETDYLGVNINEAKLRVLTFHNKPAVGGNQIENFIPQARNKEQRAEQQMVEDFVRNRIDKIIILQEKRIDPTTGKETWVSIKPPGSYLHLLNSQFIGEKIISQLDQDSINRIAQGLDLYFQQMGIQGDPVKETSKLALADLLEALFDPKVTDEEAYTTLQTYLYPTVITMENLPYTWGDWLKWSQEAKQQFDDIPQSLSIEMLMDIYRAVLSPFDDTVFQRLNGKNYTEKELFRTILENSGQAKYDCIVIPNAASTEENQQLEAMYEAVKKEFKAIPPKPRVFKLLLRNGQTRLASLHDMQNIGLDNRLIRDWDDRIDVSSLLTEYNARRGKNLSWLPAGEEVLDVNEPAIVVKDRVAGLLGMQPDEILSIEEYPQEALEAILLPNKFYGELKERLSWGIMFTGYERPEHVPPLENKQEMKAVLLSPMLRDRMTPVQAMDQTKVETIIVNGTQKSWLTDVTEIVEKNLAAGITELYPEGLLSPLEFIARAMRRSSQASEFMDSPFLQPGDPVVASFLADSKLTDLLEKTRTDNPNEAINVATFLADVPLVRIDLEDFYADGQTIQDLFGKIGINADSKIWQAFEGAMEKYSPAGGFLQDKVKEVPFTVEDRQIMMHQGDFFPVHEVIEIAGKKYLILKEVETDGSFASKTASFVAIPFTEAMQKVLILDPDNNVLEMAQNIADLALPIFLVSMVGLPGPTGKAVSWAGKNIQKRLVKIFTYLSSKVEQFFI